MRLFGPRRTFRGMPISASFDLGLGGMLDLQQQDQTEEERRKKKLGMSDRQKQAGMYDFGATGIASLDLMPGLMGMAGGRR